MNLSQSLDVLLSSDLVEDNKKGKLIDGRKLFDILISYKPKDGTTEFFSYKTGDPPIGDVNTDTIWVPSLSTLARYFSPN